MIKNLLRITILTTAVLTSACVEAIAEKDTLHIALIDDQTGEEVRDYGIEPVSLEDLDFMAGRLMRLDSSSRLLYLCVDGDASDNPVPVMEIDFFSGGEPPVAPSPSLPIAELTKQMQAYRKARAQWQGQIQAYRSRLVEEFETFSGQVLTLQLQTAEAFDRQLASRRGRDFNRSDVVGSIEKASRLLGTNGRRFLILNSDAQDLPGETVQRVYRNWEQGRWVVRVRKIESEPLTVEQLDPQVTLILVNTSYLPERSPIFKGIHNRIYHADTIPDAIEMIASIVSGNIQ